MTSPSSEPDRPADPRVGGARDWVLLVTGSFVLAGATLVLLPHSVAYDAWSWLVWGREIAHLGLDTRDAATAVKPLPMFVDALLAPAGAAAPVLWLLVARAGTFLAFGVAFRLGRLLGGALAGSVAAVFLALAGELLGRLFVNGMSEPWTTAAVLAAVDCHVRSHRRTALVWLVVAGLLRPEVWPAVLGYALWLALHGGTRRRRLRTLSATVLAGLLGVAVPAVWFALDWFGAGRLSRSADAATHQSQGGPLLSRYPGLATVRETWPLMSGPVVVLFLVGLAVALLSWQRGDRRPTWLIGLAALGWLAVDAVLAQGRLATGAPRYLMPAVGLACVVAGVGVADVLHAVRRRFAGRRGLVVAACLAGGLVLAVAPRVVWTAGQLHGSVVGGRQAESWQDGLPKTVAMAGGRAGLLRCGPVSTTPFQLPLLAWQLRVSLATLAVAGRGRTGTMLVPRPLLPSVRYRDGYRRVGGERGGDGAAWVVLTTCPTI